MIISFEEFVKSLTSQQTGWFASLEYKSLISEFRLPTMLSPCWQAYLQKEVYKDKNLKPTTFSQLQPSSSPCLVANPWVRLREKQTSKAGDYHGPPSQDHDTK